MRRVLNILAVLAMAPLAAPAAAQVGPVPNALPSTGGTMTGTLTMSGANIHFGPFGSIGPSPVAFGSINLSAGTDQYHDNVMRVMNPSTWYWQRNITCSFTNGSPVVTGCTSTSGAHTGNFVTGPGIPPGTHILNGITASGFTMTRAYTGASGPAGGVDIKRQCGNAAFNFITQDNGVTGGGYEMGAMGMSQPGDSCQGFYAGQRAGAAGGTIGYGTLYEESSYLGPPGGKVYMDHALVNTHNANADYYPGSSWTPLWIDGQTGDVRFYNHRGSAMLAITESSGAVSFGGPVTASGLSTSGVIAGSLCVTAGGLLLYEAGASACTVSLEELKRDIAPIADADAAATLRALRPIAFQMKDPPDAPRRVGFGARQVQGVDARLATVDGAGNLQAYDPNGILALTVSVVQQQQTQIAWLRWCMLVLICGNAVLALLCLRLRGRGR